MISYRRREKIALREVAGAHLLIPLSGNSEAVYTLNATGVFLWNALAEPQSITALAKLLQSRYNDAQFELVLSDIGHYLGEMAALGLVEQVQNSACVNDAVRKPGPV